MFDYRRLPLKLPMIRSHHFSAILTTTADLMLLTGTDWLDLLKATVHQVGLHCVGEVLVTFNPQGISVVLVLEESHIALHIWTESQKVAVDIHVCDYYQDNRPKAEQLADLLTVKICGDHDRGQWNYLLATG
ncbi:S-adenosylmethionine decarboxylase family protein [Pantanalinema sp. GBBB05]|uniref:S-adenosylmethionine decarboxylase family protein n=1 Tax=Pantanalinema sp. GBBB05 TaxID=2604139 RepID=UPI003D8137B7